ncbi:class I SAM-dependent methyltransferase [Vibrio sp. SCSIO 43135]|uniref:class I SAM-dependent methyltransferase n=1 Tax=Vibrio sp. SCSIO 43135 TaxID=2819096 RepID=UPI002075E8B0|nr:class I SAM-dependent methyltransferase [Vibrio sp. SCSIO 43135]USD44180.1 class I SAM-dependent methyltransferase [Vibrio sp. SCSIO 43135]
MNVHSEIWRQYYQKALTRKHSPRTEKAISLRETVSNVALDCGCGTGSDIAYLDEQGLQVHGFDCNQDAVALCRERFNQSALVDITQATFEDYDYPNAGVILAHSSLYFADPSRFEKTWQKLVASLEVGGVFSGDFMGGEDSWASHYRTPTTPLTEQQVLSLFDRFEIASFNQRNEIGTTAIGKQKRWHTFSVMAIKRR